MKTTASLLISMLLAACAGGPPMPSPEALFHDALFDAPSVPINPDEALVVSAEMRRYMATRLAGHSRFDDPRRRLFDALYRKDELRLEYDAAITRTAAQAFEGRTGNCLSLVLMTAAFAKELGLAVHYQVVHDEATWDRSGDIYLSVGHVNLVLGARPLQFGANAIDRDAMTIDFLPSRNAQALHTREIQEHTIVAMYLNNRAVEELTRGRFSDAYAWAREAIRKDPELAGAYLTLGVVYRNLHHPELADLALRRVTEREPDNTMALSNRVLVLRDLGRNAEADALAQRLARLDPHPPFSYFHQGLAALRERRLDAALALFTKEVDRAPYQHEFQFWLAITYLELHDPQRAAEHLSQAMAASTTRKDRELYSAKLDRLKARAPQ